MSNKIFKLGGTALANALRINSTIRHLYLTSNCIKDEGAEAMGKMLRHNTTLGSLSLSNNGITDKGGKFIFAALPTNYSLYDLGLNRNALSDEVQIIQGLESNSTITMLDCYQNVQVKQSRIQELLKRNCDKALMLYQAVKAAGRNERAGG